MRHRNKTGGIHKSNGTANRNTLSRTSRVDGRNATSSFVICNSLLPAYIFANLDPDLQMPIEHYGGFSDVGLSEPKRPLLAYNSSS